MKPIVKQTLLSVAVAASLSIAPLAQATNGYFKIGYGTKNRGMAGAGMAYGQDSLAPAINPATLSGVGSRVDGGVEYFRPSREGTVDGRGIGGALANEDSGSKFFFIPNMGFSKKIDSKITAGFAVVANGGMNTRYNKNLYTDAFAPAIGQAGTLASPPFPPTGGFAALLTGFGVTDTTIDAVVAGLAAEPALAPSLGINLAQVLMTPTIAYEISPQHSVGFSPVIAYQQFRAYGLGLFKGLSSDATKITNNGNDDSWGYGARVGYQGTFGKVSVGASYTSKLSMQKFDKYAGLFAEQGDLDIPPTYGIGIAVQVTPAMTVAADVTRIKYSDIASMNNAGPTADQFFAGLSTVLSQGTAPGLTVSNPLGSDNGWGFGWDDITIVKIGVDFAAGNNLNLRAGFNYNEAPYKDSEALFNILAPATVQKHITLGFTYKTSPNSEISGTYMHALEETVSSQYNGSGGFAGFGYSAENTMYQNALEISYAKLF